MKPAPRLYVPDALAEGAELTLAPDQGRYLAVVMRRGVGDSARLFNGEHGEWRAEIVEAGKKAVRLRAVEQTRGQTGVPDLHLLFAPVKKARTDFIVEKATELGAAAIRPVFTERSVAERVRTDRLTLLAREAAEQTERLDLPQIGEPEKLLRLLEGWDETDPDRALIYCDEAGDDEAAIWGGEEGRAAPALDVLAARTGDTARLAVLIGPEGGFSPEERARLRAHANVIPISLGPRILRADTACAAALTLVQAVWGDWRGAPERP